jgi:hypothetical protein
VLPSSSEELAQGDSRGIDFLIEQTTPLFTCKCVE